MAAEEEEAAEELLNKVIVERNATLIMEAGRCLQANVLDPDDGNLRDAIKTNLEITNRRRIHDVVES